MIAGENQHVLARQLGEDVEVLANRIGRALEPRLDGRCLLGGENLHIAS